MENRIENKKVRTLDEAKQVVVKIFQEMDWAQLGLISEKLQRKAGVDTPMSPYFDSIQFVNLPHRRTFSVPNATTFTHDKTEVVEVYNKNEPVVLSCDLNTLNDEGWEIASDEDFSDYVKESLLHEYSHLISYRNPAQIHKDMEDSSLPHSIVRSGVEETHITGSFHKRNLIFDSFGGRLKEVLTEYVRVLIQEEYEPKVEDRHRSSHGTYTDFVITFNVLVLSIHKYTGVETQTIINSFLRAYFNGEDVISNSFFQNLPEDFQYAYLELLKEETDGNVFWEYIQLLTSKFDISKEELLSLSLKKR